ncbi:MAG: glycosyltransferase family 4 protein [Candidatus Methanosuratincola sp.]
MGKMKALVFHHDLGGPGGAELVVASTVRGLHERDYAVELSSIFKYDKNQIAKWFGIDLSYVNSSYLLPFRINSFAIYVRLLIHKLMERRLDHSENLGVIWVDMPTYEGLKDKINEKTDRFIEYIHFPLDVMLHEDMIKEGLLFGETNYSEQRYGTLLMKYYYGLYIRYFKKYCRSNPFDYTDLVLANSNWTAQICERLYGKRPRVVNPPISPNVVINTSPPSFEDRMDRVVLLGRFTDEKRYHWVIEEVLPLMKEDMQNVEVVIIGSAGNKRAEKYVARLKETAAKKGFVIAMDTRSKADIRLITNAPRNSINSLMNESKVFMHATVNEHWGISVAEAMAAGLPVVVHKSGGAWSDLSMEGKIGVGYEDAQEASSALLRLMTDEKVWKDQSSKAITRAQNLSIERYIERIIELCH